MDATELRSLTYSRADICDRTIDPEDLQHNCPLDQTSLKTLGASPIQDATASLGRFDTIPLETTQNILLNLDLGTLTLFRSISRRANILVDSVHEYQKVITHSPNALRALLSTGAARYFTATDLYASLRAQERFLCRRFGPLLYLLECRRCCWTCLTSVPDLLPISKAAVTLLFRFDPHTAATLPTVLSIPGSYTTNRLPRNNNNKPTHPNNNKTDTKRVALVAYGAARTAAAAAAAAAMRTITIATERPRREIEPDDDHYDQAKLATRIAFRGPLRDDFMRDMDCLNSDPAGHAAGYGLEPQRFMVAVRFPTLVPVAGGTSDRVDWGVSCLGCLAGAGEGDVERVVNELFTVEGVVGHLEGCRRGGRGWGGGDGDGEVRGGRKRRVSRA